MSVCEHGYEQIGRQGPCPFCEAEETERELRAEITELQAAVREYYVFLMGESHWETADELAARFPWVREETS